MNFNIDLSDRTKAIIVVVILFILALYNYFTIPNDVFNQMKNKFNQKVHKIYAHQNHATTNFSGDIYSDLPQIPYIGRTQGGGLDRNTQGVKRDQTGGWFFNYLDQTTNNRLSPWDQAQNTWDPTRLHDLYNAESNPIVYQGFGIPLLSDLKCTSFAGLSDPTNGNDKGAIGKPIPNVLGTIPSDEKSMFYFSDNISAPECCPGPYSSDAGCVCSFEKASFPLNSSAKQYK